MDDLSDSALDDPSAGSGRRALPPLAPLGWLLGGIVMAALAMVPNATLFSSFSVGVGVSVVQALPLVLVRWRPATAVAVLCAGVVLTSALGSDVQVPWSAASIMVGLIVVGVASARTSDRGAAGSVTAVAAVASIGVLRHDMPVGIYVGVVVTVAILAVAVRLRVKLRTERRWRAAEQIRRAAEAERAALSATVHDIVGHHLAVIALTATAEEGRASTAADKDSTLAEISSHAASALAEIRAALNESSSEHSVGLHAGEGSDDESLQHLVADWSAVGLQIDHAGLDLVDAAGPELQHEAYLVIRQALTNAVQHGTTAAVRIDVDDDGRALTLRVTNAAASGQMTTGRGLSSMRERLARHGHRLEVDAQNDRFELTAVLNRAGARR